MLDNYLELIDKQLLVTCIYGYKWLVAFIWRGAGRG